MNETVCCLVFLGLMKVVCSVFDPSAVLTFVTEVMLAVVCCQWCGMQLSRTVFCGDTTE
jgi:hypothetical protein